MVGDEVYLHRLIWTPFDLGDDGKPLTSAFPTNDLKGPERYLSVSRLDIIDVECERRLAENQHEAWAGRDAPREDAFSIQLSTGAVRQVADDEAANPLAVSNEPLPENEAHCGIKNVSGKKGKGYVNRIRTILVSLSSVAEPLEEFLAAIAPNERKAEDKDAT